MASWFGSASFILFSALFGCVLGFGLAAFFRGLKDKKNSAAEIRKEIRAEKTLWEREKERDK